MKTSKRRVVAACRYHALLEYQVLHDARGVFMFLQAQLGSTGFSSWFVAWDGCGDSSKAFKGASR
jgi:hypothetical protein